MCQMAIDVLRNLEYFDLTVCNTVPIKEHPTQDKCKYRSCSFQELKN